MKRRQSTLIAITLFGLLPMLGSPPIRAQEKALPDTKNIAADNARKYFLEAAALLVEKEKFGSDLSPDAERRLVEANQAALTRLREGFAFPFTPVRVHDEADFARWMPQHASYRYLARLLASEGRVRQARGDFSGAFDSYLDAIQLGNEIARDDMMISALVGSAVAAIGRQDAWDTLPLLDAQSAKSAMQRLETLIGKRPPFADMLRAEARFGEGATRRHAQNIGQQAPGHPPLKPKTIDAMVAHYRELMEWEIAAASQPYVVSGQKPRDFFADDEDENAVENQPAPALADVARVTVERMFDQTRNTIHLARFLDTREQTHNALLLAQLGLLVHRLEHKTEADDWKLLIPAILKQAPLDPFGLNEPLRLVKQGEVFVPYSIGPDGIDDGGLPIGSNQPKAVPPRHIPIEWNSSGDIVAGINR